MSPNCLIIDIGIVVLSDLLRVLALVKTVISPCCLDIGIGLGIITYNCYLIIHLKI